jgi:hypothetical protein
MNRLNILQVFCEKGEPGGVHFAQKTAKNKCLNILKKGKCKLFFLKKIRGGSSPKYSITHILKTFRETFWLNYCIFVLYQLFGLL